MGLQHSLEHDEDDPAVRQLYELIGRIVVAWGSAESVMAKAWFHFAFEAGTELDPEKLHRAVVADKVKGLRKFIPALNARGLAQLARLEDAIGVVEPRRHALVHGYFGMSAQGPVSINLRNDQWVVAAELPALRDWAGYADAVAHQMFSEATCHIYKGVDRLFLPDPMPPRTFPAQP